MPIYDFICDDCQNTFEEIRKYENRNQSAKCSKCDGLANRNPILTSHFSRNKQTIEEQISPESYSFKNKSIGIITPMNGNFHIENCYILGVDIGILDGRTLINSFKKPLKAKDHKK